MDFSPTDIGVKDFHRVNSATVMDDGSIVIVTAAKDSPNAAVHIIRLDVVRGVNGSKELKPREEI